MLNCIMSKQPPDLGPVALAQPNGMSFMPAKRAFSLLIRDQFIKQRWLINLIVVMLMFNVPTYDHFIETNRRNKVTTSPE